jgi:iron(II)-dependent oxidoreductase
VSNAEYLAFMEDGGYRRQALWSDAGWQWRARLSRPQPEHWCRDAAGDWLQLTPGDALPLPADGSLIGSSYFEAEAYATWAGGRLPHEYEWEAAAAQGLLQGVGTVWEWCGNRFHPYPGFRAFPYEGYSVPWFDGGHHVLRGGSSYTQPCLRRATFRNFYTADKRHIFAGCRVAFDG